MAKKSKLSKKPTSGQPIADDKAHLLQKVAAISRRMDSMEEIVGLIADADDKVKTKMLGKFGTSRRRAQVYLAIDGFRDTKAIAKFIRTQRQNVNVETRMLMRNRVIDIAESDGRGTIYRKRSIDAITGLSHDLMKHFNLDSQGQQLR